MSFAVLKEVAFAAERLAAMETSCFLGGVTPTNLRYQEVLLFRELEL